MLKFLQKRWFLLALVVLISSGMTVGARAPADHVKGWTSIIPPGMTTTIILFLMAFSLDSRHVREAFRAPWPVVWAGLVSYGFIPLIAWPLKSLQAIPDFATGLMIAASVPCTLAAASVWTRKARGNDAISLLVTLSTNGLCFLVTPVWLKLTTAQSVELDAASMVQRLMWTVLVPTLLGQALRQPPPLNRLATRFKVPIGVAAQLLILLMVLTAALKAGATLGANETPPRLVGLVTVWVTCMAVHVTAMFVGYQGARLFGFAPANRAAIVFACSQKTLPIGLLLATDERMFGGKGLPFVVFPMLLYHVSQLFIDTAVADRLALQSVAAGD